MYEEACISFVWWSFCIRVLKLYVYGVREREMCVNIWKEACFLSVFYVHTLHMHFCLFVSPVAPHMCAVCQGPSMRPWTERFRACRVKTSGFQSPYYCQEIPTPLFYGMYLKFMWLNTMNQRIFLNQGVLGSLGVPL